MTITEFLDAGGTIGTAIGGGYNATNAEKLHGHGPTPEDAILNIGATIIPLNGRRQLHRTNGDVIELDLSLVPQEDAPAVVEEHRAPDDEQPIALAKAEAAGTLPKKDRRATKQRAKK